MKTRGVTLIELVTVILISGIVILALTCEFVAEQTFRTRINDQIYVINEASIAMHHMTRILRYANTPINTSPAAGYSASITATINQALANQVSSTQDQNLPEMSNLTPPITVIYGIRTSDNAFVYKITDSSVPSTSSTYIISNYITAFPAVWASGDLTLGITASKGGASSSLETKIHPMGG